MSAIFIQPGIRKKSYLYVYMNYMCLLYVYIFVLCKDTHGLWTIKFKKNKWHLWHPMDKQRTHRDHCDTTWSLWVRPRQGQTFLGGSANRPARENGATKNERDLDGRRKRFNPQVGKVQTSPRQAIFSESKSRNEKQKIKEPLQDISKRMQKIA